MKNSVVFPTESTELLWLPESPPLSDEALPQAPLLVEKRTANRQRFAGLAAGGDKSLAHQTNKDKIEAYLEDRLSNRIPLPANPHRPEQVSMTYVAEEAGVAKEVLLRHRSKLRNLVQAAEKKLGVAVAFEVSADRELLWSEAMHVCIAERRRQNDEEGAPLDNAVPRLRKFFYAVEKPYGAKRSVTAAECLAFARSPAGRRKLSVELQEEIEFVAFCLDRYAANDGIPQNLAGALSVGCRRIGLTPSSLARNIGAEPQTVINWAAGRKSPDPRMFPLLRRIAVRFRWPEDTLVDMVKSARLGSGAIRIGEFPQRLRGREFARVRARIAILLPNDYLFLPAKQRQRLMRDAVGEVEHEDGKRVPRGANYGIHKWPKRLGAQWDDLKRHKRSIVLTKDKSRPDSKREVSNSDIWTGGGARKWHDHLSQIFGVALLPDAGEFQTDERTLSFALLANVEFVEMAIMYKVDRTTTSEHEPNVSHTDVDVLTLGAALFKNGGWARNHPGIRADCGFAKSTDAKWTDHCDAIVNRYKNAEAKFRAHARKRERRVIRHKSVLAILKMLEPLVAVKMLADGLERDRRSAKGEMLRAQLLQDLIYVLIQAQVAFRPGTTVRITYRRNGKGHLYRNAEGRWCISAPKEIFKNRTAEALENDFHRVLHDDWGLYALLDEFVTKDRFVLLGKTKTDALFVYGRPEWQLVDSEVVSSLKEHDNRRELALASRVRAFTARHLGWNPKMGTGIEGIISFSPTGFRHILATSMVKNTGNFQKAADAIADSYQIVKKHYARYKPDDRAAEVESDLAAIARSARERKPAAAMRAGSRRVSGRKDSSSQPLSGAGRRTGTARRVARTRRNPRRLKASA